MRAAIFQGIGRPLAIEDVPDPAPGPGEVVLAVGLCGICGSDLHRTAGHGVAIPPGSRMGHEFAGTVIALGRDVTRARLGDRAAVLPQTGCRRCSACNAGEYFWCERGFRSLSEGFAEFALAVEDSLQRLPDALSLADGALIEPLAAALNGLELLENIAGARILVFGLGAMGLGSVYWARRLGTARIVATARSRAQARRAMEMGADAFLAAGPTLAAEAAEAMGGAPDIVIDCAGARGVVAEAIAIVKARGTVLGMGMCGREDEYSPAVAIRKQVRLQFAVAYSMRHFLKVAQALDSGAVEPRLMVTRTIALADLPETFETLRKPSSDCKVLVEP